jgi:hypothetical protein
MPEVNCGFQSPPGSDVGRDLLVYLGPTLIVDIGFDPSYIPGLYPPTAPIPGMRGLQALVDTGALESCIDNLLASQLNLPVVDRTLISGLHGSHEANVFIAQIHIPSLDFTIYGNFVGVDLQAGGQGHCALIGRTFLQNFTMTYEGRTGTVITSSLGYPPPTRT